MKKRIISYITLICITISLCCTAVVAFGIVPELEEQVVKVNEKVSQALMNF